MRASHYNLIQNLVLKILNFFPKSYTESECIGVGLKGLCKCLTNYIGDSDAKNGINVFNQADVTRDR